MMRLVTMMVWLAFGLGTLLWLNPAACGGESKDKSKPAITLTLHFPGQTKVSATRKYVEKFESMKGLEVFIREPVEGKGIYAEVSGTARASPKAVAGVVEELLRLGVPKISLEVKK
jgi:hypothetical protein